MAEAKNNGVMRCDLVAFISAATTDVFSTMLGQDVTADESYVEKMSNAPSSGIVSLVGLAGEWVGTGGISCTAHLACRISSIFLMAEYDSVNEDVLDAIAEFTNMIIGNVKTALEEQLGPMGLSIPTVIFGRNFQTRNSGSHEWVVVPFNLGEDRFHVQICLSPNRDATQKVIRAGQPVPHLLSV